MHTFHFKASSWILFVLTFITVLFTGIYFMFLLPHQEGNPAIIVLLFFTVFGLALLAAKFVSQVETKWTLTDTEIKLEWIGQFLFQNRPSLKINWSDIEEYKFQPDRNFDLLSLRLKDGIKIRLWHSTFLTKDDFERFIRYFEKEVGKYNSAISLGLSDIKRSKNIYETKAGMWFAIFVAFWMIAIPILYLFPHKGKINWAGLGIGYSGGIYYILQVLAHRKKKDDEIELL
jgi:hypothetical protein